VPGIDATLNLEPQGSDVLYDMQIGPDGDVLTEDSLETAILASCFTDRRAEPEQAPIARMRRGWVGDLETPGDPFGSLLWLLDQSRVTATVAAQAVDFVERALEWMVQDGIAIAIHADAEIDTTTVRLIVDLDRPNSRSDRFLVMLWDNTGRP